MKVFVIAESIDQAAPTCRALVDAGHRVAALCEETDSLEDCIAAICAGRPDVVLLDLASAAVDATELVAEVSSAPDHPAILLCTAVQPTMIGAVDGSVAGVLKKPFTMDELLDFLELVGMRRLRASRIFARPSRVPGVRRQGR